MRHLKYILFILIMILVPNVYAQEFNVSNIDITCPLTSGTGKYCGAEVYYTGTSGAYNIGTRYDGRLNRIWFNLIAGGYADSEGFEKGHTYTVSMNMATNDWNNKFGSVSVKCEGSSGTELVKGGITYVSYKKIKFTFQAPANDWCQFVYVDIRASSGNTITQISNWNLSSLTINDSAYIDGGSSGGSSGGTTDPNQSVIDANNQNTTDIINNNNQNTSDIIDNINEASSTITNTMDQMFGNKCSNLLSMTNLVNGIYYIGNGTFGSSENNTATENRIEIDNTKNYVLSVGNNNSFSIYAMFYNASGTYLGNISSQNGTLSLNTFADYSSVKYVNFRFDIAKSSLIDPMFAVGITRQTYCEYGSYSSKLDDTNKEMKDLNDKLDGLGRVIEDSQIDDKTSFFTGFTDNAHGLSGIISIPLNAIQSLANSQCQPLTLPLPFTDTTITLPCMSEYYEEHIPTLYALVQTLIYGFMAYRILIDIFAMVKGFKDPENDKIEVLDL